MSSADIDVRKKVFRVRGLPNDVKTRADACSLVSRGLGLSASDVTISSLATSLDYWETPPSRVCTLQFNAVPQSFGTQLRPGEWHVPLPGNANEAGLVLDTHFLGLTPLNDVDESQHALDIISISGLGSHPFGSWQPHGSDKSYMWIRDEIPGSVAGARAITYGYAASLADSDSFQSIRDIARGFFEQLRATGWQRDAAAPLAFLAHSLGGIVLMDALLQVADSRNNVDASILDKVRGMILFGVPTLGMEQTSLQTMIEGQANEILLQDLSRESNYLRNLNQSYFGVAHLRQLRVFWGYETRTTPTVQRGEDRRWVRTGSHQILVDRRSATYRNIDHNAQSTFPINENHSDLVKFTRGDPGLRTVISNLNAMLLPQDVSHEGNTVSRPRSAVPTDTESRLSEHKTPLEFTYDDVTRSLKAPDLDARVTTIEDRFGQTLDWVFELQDFTTWLQYGTEIFWISGKPGSGKSTLMKFITQNSKTWDLVHSFERRALEISASFFFHFRGSVMQKSFEGVLRSLLKQILTEAPAVFATVQSILPAKQGNLDLPKWTVSRLEQCLMAILEQKICQLDLCLFFDALDEFDGHHSLICNFLKRLVSLQPTSSTCVKVCFSSRPWDIFENNFGECRGFQIQDHTQGDIRDYCLTSLSHLELDPLSMEELVLDIVTRAEGVFLWVKLVLAQLPHEHSQQGALSLADMQATMKALPTELDEFYDFILQRIPRSLRWQTYALLDTLVRANDADPSDVSSFFVFSTVLISDCRTYGQALKKHHAVQREMSSMIYSGIANWGGGLAEIVDADLDSSVQLMHQTVDEFVKSSKFKERVLGDLDAKIIHENGHTFLAKSKLVWQHWHRPPQHHLLAAEATTGRSLFSFLRDLPPDAFLTTAKALGVPGVATSWLGLAASLGLQLFIRDVAAQLPSALKDTKEKILECVLRGYNETKYETAALLLESGLNPHERIDDLWQALWASMTGLSPLQPDFAKLASLERELALLLFRRGWDPRQGIAAQVLQYSGYQSVGDRRYNLLHIALPELTESLLTLGIDVNTKDSRGSTALDWILEAEPYSSAHVWRVKKARILAGAGGRPSTCKKPVSWYTAEEFLTPEQLDSWTRDGWTAPPKRRLWKKVKDKLGQ